jgi:3-methyladenine DNA glycosylase AlkD
MNFSELQQRLTSLGSESKRRVYARHGVGPNQFGVSFGDLKRLRKEVGQDHALAQKLWSTGNHDCRVLATMMADPAQADDNLLEAWLGGLDNYVLTDAFAGYVAQTPLAREKTDPWRRSGEEWPGRAGWNLVAHLAMKDAHLSNSYFQDCLETIEQEVHASKNRVRDAMNNALIAIATRNQELEPLGLAAAQRIGKIEVDHGQTRCKTPDATEYIRQTLEHRRRKRARAS